jgi:DNA-binding XRE family transcriptional regulator
MLAVVKTPRIKLKIEGQIPDWIVVGLKKEYGKNVKISDVDENDRLVRAVDTKWYKDAKKMVSPGATLKVYRENLGLTQEELGKKLGAIPRQHVSGMENGSRGISKAMAKKLSALFDIPVSRLI